MNKFSHYYGFDISKYVFDVMDEQGAHYQYENDLSGFTGPHLEKVNHSYPYALSKEYP